MNNFRLYKLPVTFVILTSIAMVTRAEEKVDLSKQANRGQADFRSNVVLQIDPQIAEGFYSRGLDYEVKGDFDKAISDYTEAIRMNTNEGI